MNESMVKCPNEGCNAFIHYSSLSEHLRECDYLLMYCINRESGCNYKSIKKKFNHLCNIEENTIEKIKNIIEETQSVLKSLVGILLDNIDDENLRLIYEDISEPYSEKTFKTVSKSKMNTSKGKEKVSTYINRSKETMKGLLTSNKNITNIVVPSIGVLNYLLDYFKGDLNLEKVFIKKLENIENTEEDVITLSDILERYYSSKKLKVIYFTRNQSIRQLLHTCPFIEFK